MAFIQVSIINLLWPLAAIVFFTGSIIIRRRYFHPLSNVPGPFLWSISTLPIWYHQVVRGGRLLHVLPELHKIYGPVVRISTNETHISSSTDTASDYEQIYKVGSKFLKDPAFYKPMEAPVATPILLTILSLDEHRLRRKMITPFFSRQSVLDVEDMVWQKAHKLCDTIEAAPCSREHPFPAYKAVRAVAIDVITEYAYAKCWDYLDDGKDFGNWYPEAIRSVQTMFPWLQAFPVLIPLFQGIPDWGKVVLFPAFKRWNDSLLAVCLAVKEVRRELAASIKPPRRTIIHDLIDPPAGTFDHGKMRVQLSDAAVFADAVNVTGAGTETTGATKERAMFEVMSNPLAYQTLTKELRDAFPDGKDMCLTRLEKLPYLTGVIKEALRLNPGVPGRLPRVVPSGGSELCGVRLAPGSVTSMSAWDMHRSAEVFPNPDLFDPNRWTLGSADEIRARERHLVAFSRGSRGCVGQNLAMCELYCTIAAVFHRFDDLAVYGDFGHEDMEMTELVLGYHPQRRRFKIMRTGKAAL
ncbi:cytochrome P450 [Podospora didyma]|uniref:Cytochrome P450 n=1 Tax=Podospora didyma TaxID=330526 RepID=A0AAE0NUN1_9PEZI|nr:cytochrome P450 [Podospora didyma]